jgi:hypothetical protein
MFILKVNLSSFLYQQLYNLHVALLGGFMQSRFAQVLAGVEAGAVLKVE